MTYPLISIILPTYNGSELIREALESLIKQNYPNIEIFISDDNSTDDTYEICQKYKKKYKNIFLTKNKFNLGGTENFLKTFKDNARGELFLWAQQDDIWDQNFLSKLYNEMSKDKNILISMCKTAVFLENSQKIIDYYAFDGEFNPNKMNNFKLAKHTLKCFFPGVKMPKFNIFIHGLIKTSYFKSILNKYPGLFATERHLLVQMALIGRFQYISEILYFRKIYIDENRRKHTGSYKFRNVWYSPLRNLIQILFSVFSSNELTFVKKTYIIPIMINYYIERVLLFLIPKLKIIMPKSIYIYIKKNLIGNR